MGLSNSPDRRENAFNPNNERPAGPVQVDLTAAEAEILQYAAAQSIVDLVTARIAKSPDATPSKDDFVWTNDFKNNVVHLLGEGTNGFDEESALALLSMARSALYEIELGGRTPPADLYDPKDLASVVRKFELACGQTPR